MRSFLRLKPISITILVGAFLSVAESRASDFSFFSEPELDYWKQSPPKAQIAPATPVNSQESGKKVPPTASTGIFQWQKYLDPKHDEFFREGDYTPPAPFMEIARNPTDSNIENWFRYLEQKNQLLRRLQEKLTAYAASHGQGLPVNLPPMPAEMMGAAAEAPAVVTRAAARLPIAPTIRPDAKRFRMRLYFDSHCPHCEHMLSTTIRDLSAQGYWIELKQVDRDEVARARIPFPVSPASPDELKRYGIESVPVLLVGDLQKKAFFKLPGYQPTNNVLASLNGH